MQEKNLASYETLSVSIIAFNEERIIEKTLESIKDLANEIIFVDSYSTDKTVEIAKKYTDKIYIEKWKGYSEQKNLALSKCKCSWILSLDADEVLPTDLVNEIKLKLKLKNKFNGYKIARKLFIGSQLIKYGGYFPDYQLRLFKNNIGAHFENRAVHESIKLNGEIGFLQNPLNHYAYETLEDYKSTLEKYAILASKEIKNKKFYFPILRASWAFFYRYFLRLGFLDGNLGLSMALVYWSYVYKKYFLASKNA